MNLYFKSAVNGMIVCMDDDNYIFTDMWKFKGWIEKLTEDYFLEEDELKTFLDKSEKIDIHEGESKLKNWCI